MAFRWPAVPSDHPETTALAAALAEVFGDGTVPPERIADAAMMRARLQAHRCDMGSVRKRTHDLASAVGLVALLLAEERNRAMPSPRDRTDSERIIEALSARGFAVAPA